MTNAGTEKDNFILPASPVGGLPISPDPLHRMKLVHNRTIPITLLSGKNILDNMVFKISIGYTNLHMRQTQIWLSTQQKIMSFLAIFKKTHFRITIPYCKVCRHKSEFVKTIYLDATKCIISSRALMVALHQMK